MHYCNWADSLSGFVQGLCQGLPRKMSVAEE